MYPSAAPAAYSAGVINARIITVNGKINAEQTKVIAEAAEKFGSGEVEFTTRLTVEVRGVHFDNIEPFREYIAKAGLETGGTGSLVRPIVSCKGTTCQNGHCAIHLPQLLQSSLSIKIVLSSNFAAFIGQEVST